MNRRQFAISALCASTLPQHSMAAYKYEPFVMDTWRDLRGGDDLLILYFRASWSITDDLKTELLDELICNTPAYAKLRIVEVDWDTFGPSEMALRLKVQRNATLVLLRGREELSRLENEPYERPIRQFLDRAVAAG